MSTTTVVRKRKHSVIHDPWILRLSSSPTPGLDAVSESESAAGISTPKFQSSPSGSNKAYHCSYEGCSKVYAKPSRLLEHERSHTGDRPFQCSTCNKSYLRESHLQAHVRSHLPTSSRPYACDQEGCEKRFWTTQHLRVHVEWHQGEKPFKCTEANCEAAYSKHHHLREHLCSAHAPPGTKPYRCEHDGCSKSFFTAQKLRAHVKTHDNKRYTCVHPKCAGFGQTEPTYYPTWTALQHHMQDAHPPTCPHPSCHGKTFTTQKGLRVHMKAHEDKDMEADLREDRYEGGDEGGVEPPYKKRRGGELGRDFVCDFESCEKDFKSKKALINHHNVNHLGRRDFVCFHTECKRAFGYKHLLQRHLAKVHVSKKTEEASPNTSTEDDLESPQRHSNGFSIDDITGVSYSLLAKTQTTKLQCPYPDLTNLADDGFLAASSAECVYTFTRAYDLRRHFLSGHGLSLTKDRADEWVRRAKQAKISEA